ncbi:MAG: OmpA family protein [Flammeovirgaceae bacterium]|nr:OmpA family protein [Flammeovirgaceae bacterium]
MKSHFLTTALLLLAFSSFAQYGTSFYHLGNATMQSTDYNPAFFPEGKFFLKLPGPGYNVYLNNKFSYNDLFTKQDDGDILIDADRFVDNLGITNSLTGDISLNLFHIGYQFGPRNEPDSTGLGIDLFVAVKNNLNFTYPESLIDLLWRGNGAFLDQEQKMPFGANLNSYIERGIGLAYTLPKSNLKLGLRLKLLNGLQNFSTPNNTELSVLTKGAADSYEIEIGYQNMLIRSAGLVNLDDNDGVSTAYVDDLIDNADYMTLAFSGNKGFAVDLGVEYKIDSNFTVALAINDLGSINWTENVSTFSLNTTFRGDNSGFTIPFFDLLDDNLDNVLADTFDNNIDYEILNDSYRQNLPTRIIGSLIYSPWDEKTDIIATMNARVIQGEFRSGYGIGINQRFGPKFILSTSVTKLPQQGLNMGMAISATAGFVQFYAGLDKMFGYSVYNLDWIQGQAGINLVFGSGPKHIKKVKPSKEVNIQEVAPYKGMLYIYPIVGTDTTTANVYINDERVNEMFGAYTFGIVSDTTYQLRVEKEGFIVVAEPINISDSIKETRIYKNVELLPIDIKADLSLEIVSTEGEAITDGILTLTDDSENEVMFNGTVSSGSYQTPVDVDKMYTYKVKAREYFFKQGSINVSSDETKVNERIVLTKIIMNKRINDFELLLEFGSFEISTDLISKLAFIVDLLRQNENIKMEISGHTDDVGASSYNLKLSEKRANYLMTYLINEGVNEDQLIAKGYGKSQPLVPNISAENRARNRRVEFIIRAID